MREVAEAKKDCRNSKRREKRAKEKLGEMEAKVEDMEMVVRATSDENELLHEQLDESTSRNSELKQRLTHYSQWARANDPRKWRSLRSSPL